MITKKTVLLLTFLSFLITSPLSFSEEEKPVEAWIVYKKEGDKVVEVVKIRTSKGKVYEIEPHIPPEKIPKPVNTLPEKTLKVLLIATISFILGILAGIGVLMRKLKEEKGP